MTRPILVFLVLFRIGTAITLVSIGAILNEPEPARRVVVFR